MQMFEQMGKQIKVFWILVKLKIRFFGVVMVFENRRNDPQMIHEYIYSTVYSRYAEFMPSDRRPFFLF